MNEIYFNQRLATILSLGFSESRVPALKKYLELLWSSNLELNLFSRQMKFEELIDNHVVDCLLPTKQFPQNARHIADLGSGGGLPGVLYAINFPDRKFHLFEKSNLKRGFLAHCQRLAPNIELHAEIQSDLKGVDLVIARAFKPLDVILDMTRAYYVNGGRYFILKARREKIDEEIILAKKGFKDLEVRIESLHSPVLEVERNLVLIHI